MQQASARTEAGLGGTAAPRLQGGRLLLRQVRGQAHFGRHAMDDLLHDASWGAPAGASCGRTPPATAARPRCGTRRVGQKMCVPSLRETKKRSSHSSGWSAAWSAALPGLAMGPGGRPVDGVRVVRVLGLQVLAGDVLRVHPAQEHHGVDDRGVRLQLHPRACRRLWKTQEMRGRSSGAPVSFSTMEARVMVSRRSSVTPGLRRASALPVLLERARHHLRPAPPPRWRRA